VKSHRDFSLKSTSKIAKQKTTLARAYLKHNLYIFISFKKKFAFRRGGRGFSSLTC